jgi:hypothetical protein
MKEAHKENRNLPAIGTLILPSFRNLLSNQSAGDCFAPMRAVQRILGKREYRRLHSNPKKGTQQACDFTDWLVRWRKAHSLGISDILAATTPHRREYLKNMYARPT